MTTNKLQSKEQGGALVFAIILFTAIIFFSVLYGLASKDSPQFQNAIMQNDYLGMFSTILSSGIASLTGALGLLALAGSVFYPNPYLLFGGIFGILMSIMGGLSSSVLGGQLGNIPEIVFFFVNTIITIMLVIFTIDWLKGARQA